jgi:hypothetical protein
LYNTDYALDGNECQVKTASLQCPSGYETTSIVGSCVATTKSGTCPTGYKALGTQCTLEYPKTIMCTDFACGGVPAAWTGLTASELIIPSYTREGEDACEGGRHGDSCYLGTCPQANFHVEGYDADDYMCTYDCAGATSVNCGYGCASSAATCREIIGDQVLAVTKALISVLYPSSSGFFTAMDMFDISDAIRDLSAQGGPMLQYASAIDNALCTNFADVEIPQGYYPSAEQMFANTYDPAFEGTYVPLKQINDGVIQKIQQVAQSVAMQQYVATMRAFNEDQSDGNIGRLIDALRNLNSLGKVVQKIMKKSVKKSTLSSNIQKAVSLVEAFIYPVCDTAGGNADYSDPNSIANSYGVCSDIAAMKSRLTWRGVVTVACPPGTPAGLCYWPNMNPTN